MHSLTLTKPLPCSWNNSKMESHQYHDKGRAMPSWEYLPNASDGVPYCAKNMNQYSTWRASLLKVEIELLKHCKANAIVLQPESITSEMLEWMVFVKEWFLAGAESEQQRPAVAVPLGAEGAPAAACVTVTAADQVEQVPAAAPAAETEKATAATEATEATEVEQATAAAEVEVAAKGKKKMQVVSSSSSSSCCRATTCSTGYYRSARDSRKPLWARWRRSQQPWCS